MSGQTAYSTVPTTDYSIGHAADVEDISSSSVVQDALLIPPTYTYQQTRGCYPGFAFCKFRAGIIETIIRVLVMVCASFLLPMLSTSILPILLQVVLIGLISLYGVRISETKDKVYDHGVSGSDNWQFGSFLVIFAASIGFTIEGIMMLLHFLNPSCFNNCYKIFAAMVMMYWLHKHGCIHIYTLCTDACT